MFGLQRFSLGSVALFGSASLLFVLLVFSLAPITSPLPEYTGPHEVGILDVETVVKKRILNDAILKATGEKAFELSTLAVTLYYPASLPPPNPSAPQPLARPWLPQPISLIGTGYARLLNVYFPPLQAGVTFMLWLLGSKTVIPGHVDAPLLTVPEKPPVEPIDSSKLKRVVEKSQERLMQEEKDAVESEVEKKGEGLPLVVFTHGMAGMSQSYSHYLGSIASHGYVVAAVEHRDGSGPGTIIHNDDGTEKRRVWHVETQDFDPPMELRDLQIAQLAFRQAEIEETIRLFRLLNAGHGSTMPNLKSESPRTVLPSFKGRLNMDAVTVAGHSYGATGALQALKDAPSEFMPINGGIALDPGKVSGPLNDDIDIPLLIMQSGEWTEKQTEFYGQGWHFDVVRKLAEKTKTAWFMTLTGTAHPSITDAPLIVPWIMKLVTGTTLDSKIALREYIDVSVDFLEYLRSGKKRGLLKSDETSQQGPLGDSEKRGKVKGSEGADWEVHVVP